MRHPLYAQAYPAEKRSEIARRGAEARWSIPKATHTGELEIGDLRIACAVLPDGTRLLSQRGVGRALGRGYGGKDWKGQEDSDAGKLPFFLTSKAINPFISNELLLLVTKPILYRSDTGGGAAHGATIKALAARQIQVIVLQLGNLDLTSPAGKLMLKMLSAVAEMERDLLVERTQSGLARAKAAGKTLGRPTKTTDAQREEIIARHQQGVSISELARIYNVSRISIARVAKPKEEGGL